jgi:altronate dehydratase
VLSKGVLVISQADSVATALEHVAAGTETTVRLGDQVSTIRALEPIPFGFKIALVDIPQGTHVLKYGESIGVASCDIQAGQLVHVHNIEGGLSTLEEKSLGAIHKAGSSPIQAVLAYAERPAGKGLYFVDNWMSVNSIFAGYAAAGAQLCIFQLGGGGWAGNDLLRTSTAVVAPLMWTTANPSTLAMASTGIDFYSGTVLEGQETIAGAGERLLQTVLDIASGTMTRVETLRHTDPTQIYLKEPPF